MIWWSEQQVQWNLKCIPWQKEYTWTTESHIWAECKTMEMRINNSTTEPQGTVMKRANNTSAPFLKTQILFY